MIQKKRICYAALSFHSAGSCLERLLSWKCLYRKIGSAGQPLQKEEKGWAGPHRVSREHTPVSSSCWSSTKWWEWPAKSLVLFSRRAWHTCTSCAGSPGERGRAWLSCCSPPARQPGLCNHLCGLSVTTATLLPPSKSHGKCLWGQPKGGRVILGREFLGKLILTLHWRSIKSPYSGKLSSSFTNRYPQNW